jgi:hypothetical protein
MTEDENPMGRLVKGFKTRITVKKVENASIGGIQFLLDVRHIE